MSMELRLLFEKVSAGRDMARDEARWVFERIMAGEMPEMVIAGLLGCLAVKGEAVDELVGAAEAMRAAAIRVRCDADCIDTCGTGGDGISTFNVSTTAAIMAAAAGATVAKHGNRSTTRVSGSTEVLSLLGIDVEADPTVVERSLAEARIGYLNARQLHPAMKYAAPVRQALPMRTIFNLLGPLTNPAGARRQVLGVPRPELVDKMARSLLALGATHAWVVHGDGLCDLTITGSTMVVEVRDGRLTPFAVQPEDVSLARSGLDALRVASPGESAEAVMRILAGERGPARDHALLNAAAALVVAGVAGENHEGGSSQVDAWRHGVSLAAQAVDSGAAMETLERWRAIAGTSA